MRNPERAHFFFGGELRKFNLLPQLSRIRGPTLLTGGEDGPVTTIQDADDVAAVISLNLVRFERFRDAGHGVYRDKPEEFFKRLREFILS